MPDATTFGLFLSAAIILALVPGPGLLYVLARTLRGGRKEGILSTLGTGLGGLVHTVAAAAGISAILATSATAFAVVKYLGAAYLIYLGIRTLLERDTAPEDSTIMVFERAPERRHDTFRQGLIIETLNPKTALFFLAFVPQFIDPIGSVFLQFLLLGSTVTLLNSGVDLIVAFAADPLSRALRNSRRLRLAQRAASGGTMLALGSYVAAAET